MGVEPHKSGKRDPHQLGRLLPAAHTVVEVDAGKKERVWVGSDAFKIATNRSNVYVAARSAYCKEFEPTKSAKKKERQKLMLARAIDASVLRPDPVRKKFGKYVDISRINEALEKDDKAHAKAVRRYEEAGAALCKVLDSRLFKFFQSASQPTEGAKSDARSPALSEHIRVLGVTSRMLGQCTAGQGLLATWAKDAERIPKHFVNWAVLPIKAPPVAHYKAFRWGLKALASLLAEFFVHRVRVRKIAAKEAVAELIEPLLRLGVGDAFDPVTQVTDISRLDDLIKHGNVDLERFRVKVKLPDGPRVVKFDYVGPKAEKMMEDWLAEGQLKNFGRSKQLLDAKFLGAAILDAINLGLCIKAVVDAKDGTQYRAAMFGGVASGTSLLVSIADQAVEKGWIKISETKALAAKRVFVGVRSVVGLYYTASNAIGAVQAFRKGDNDKGFALSVAATAELAAVFGQVWAVWAPASLVAPWVIVVAGAVAAAAYITATFVADHPLEKFLEYCEWGKDRYGDLLYEAKWSDGPVSTWQSSYPKQAQMLLRVLLRLTASWDLKQWPGITVTWAMLDPGTHVEVKYQGLTSTGGVITETLVFEGKRLPRKTPIELKVKPKKDFKNAAGIQQLFATVTFKLSEGADAEKLSCLLMTGGIGRTKGEVTRVE